MPKWRNFAKSGHTVCDRERVCEGERERESEVVLLRGCSSSEVDLNLNVCEDVEKMREKFSLSVVAFHSSRRRRRRHRHRQVVRSDQRFSQQKSIGRSKRQNFRTATYLNVAFSLKKSETVSSLKVLITFAGLFLKVCEAGFDLMTLPS